jgi:hypothetical protein
LEQFIRHQISTETRSSVGAALLAEGARHEGLKDDAAR